MKTSSYSGFFKLSTEERMKEVAEFCGLTQEEQAILKDANSLDMDKADHMIENVIGRYTYPLGVAINFVINGKDYVIPMASEDPPSWPPAPTPPRWPGPAAASPPTTPATS